MQSPFPLHALLADAASRWQPFLMDKIASIWLQEEQGNPVPVSLATNMPFNISHTNQRGIVQKCSQRRFTTVQNKMPRAKAGHFPENAFT
jgi:hypothetical protein